MAHTGHSAGRAREKWHRLTLGACLCAQLQYAVQYMLADEGGPERLVVVIDGRGISAHSEHRSRYVRQVKALVSALTEVGSSFVDLL